jgi:hypothetical protein
MLSFKSILQLDLSRSYVNATCHAIHLRDEANTIQQAQLARQYTTTTALIRQREICNFHAVKL